MNRREFLQLSAPALAGLAAGCATAQSATARIRPPAFIKAVLAHLGSNMWCDVFTDDKPRKKGWDDKVRVDYLRADESVWRANTAAAAKHGFNMIVIDLGEALAYPSHPELRVKGTWSVAKMRDEIARLRDLGLEAIPKINLSTTHNAWMKDWRWQVSTPAYLNTVDDLIRDVADVFDHPRFIHLGYDEETIGHQAGWGRYEYVVVRRGNRWWHDFLRSVGTVRSVGCRPWCFSDQIWYEHDRFVRNMPRDVVMCPWNCVKDPKNPKYTKTIGEMAALGFDFIPDGSTYTREEQGIQTSEVETVMDYCREVVPAAQLKGFVICPWVTSVPGVPQRKFLDSLAFAESQFKKRGW